MDSNKSLRMIVLRGLVLDDVRQWYDYQILKYCFQNGFISEDEYNSLTMFVDDNIVIDMKNLENDE